jgi:hypothetical protein
MEHDTTITIPDDEVKDYVSRNFRVDDVFSDSDIKEYVADNFQPNDVFNDSELSAWAEANGYVSQSIF